MTEAQVWFWYWKHYVTSEPRLAEIWNDFIIRCEEASHHIEDEYECVFVFCDDSRLAVDDDNLTVALR